MPGAAFSLQVTDAYSIGCTHSLVKSAANDEMYFVTRWTAKGIKINKQFSLNTPNYTAYTDAKTATDLKDSSVRKCNITINSTQGGGKVALSFTNVTIIEVGIDTTSTRAAQDQLYYVVFEETSDVPSGGQRINQLLGITSADLKNIDNVSASDTTENNVTGTINTKEVRITSVRDGINKSAAENYAKTFFAMSGTGTDTPGTLGVKTVYSSIYDDLTKTYSFSKTTTNFKNGGKISSSSFNIQNDGSINAVQNTELFFSSDTTIDQLITQAKAEIGTAKSALEAFVREYYIKGYGSLPGTYNNNFIVQNQSFSVDEAANKSQVSVSITNNANFNENARVQSSEEEIKETNNITKEVTKTVRGTIVGILEPPSKKTNTSDNKKLDNAKSYFDTKYSKEFKDGSTRAKVKDGTLEGMITNASVNYNISDGSLNYSLIYNYGPKYTTKSTKIIFGSAEGSQSSATHLINKFLIFGAQGKGGEELIQMTDQSNAEEMSLKINALGKDSASTKDFVTTDLKTILEEQISKDSSVIKNININYDLISCNIQAQASWLNYAGIHRTFGDLSQTSTGINLSL